jgi:hypothetical protein
LSLLHAAGLTLMMFTRSVTGGLEIAGLLAGLGTLAIAPVGQALIDGFGWKAAMTARAEDVVEVAARERAHAQPPPDSKCHAFLPGAATPPVG